MKQREKNEAWSGRDRCCFWGAEEEISDKEKWE